MDDVLALEALLELSKKLNPKSQCHIADKKFPLLDNATVESAMGSVAYVLENKPKWTKSCVNLVKRWCDVRDIGVSCRHLSWMGTISSFANIDCLLAACNSLTDTTSTSNLLSLELHQQQAICLAITCLADKSQKARKLTIELFEIIIDHPEATSNHSDFLTRIWKLRRLLELSTKQIENLVQKCSSGLEKELLSYAMNCMKSEGLQLDIFKQNEEMDSLVNLCISSPTLFQVTTSILLHLIQRSQAQQDIVNNLTDFVQKCTSDEQNLVKLFPAKCQVALALLSISPEKTDCDSYIEYLCDVLADLPSSTTTLLLILNFRWLPLLVDKLNCSQQKK